MKTMIDLTPIFQAVIALLAALVTYKLIPWIKARTNETQQEALAVAARIVVYAAEQVYGAGHGEEKLDYALKALEDAGYKIDKSLAREAIEKAVAEIQGFRNFGLYNVIEDDETVMPQIPPDENAEG